MQNTPEDKMSMEFFCNTVFLSSAPKYGEEIDNALGQTVWKVGMIIFSVASYNFAHYKCMPT